MSIMSDHWIRSKCQPPVAFAGFEDKRQFGHNIWTERPIYDGFEGTIQEEANRIAKAYCGANQAIVQPLTPQKKKWLAENFKPMIEPYVSGQVRGHAKNVTPMSFDLTSGGIAMRGAADIEKVISYGTSSYGYDVRCSDEFKVFTNINSTVVDPKNFNEDNFVTVKGPKVILPPNSFALSATMERFRIPRNVLTVCLGKSTYARCGIIVNVTPLEPEWEGHVTLEFSNTTSLPAIIYANEGCAQMLFFEGDQPCEVSYKDRNGKYQNQSAEPVPPKV